MFASIAALFFAFSATVPEIIAWWLVIFLCCIPPMLYVLAQRTFPFDSGNIQRYQLVHTCNAAISGFAWGVGIAILADPSSNYSLTSSFLLLACYVIAAIIVLGDFYRSYIALLVAGLTPFGLTMLMHGSRQSLSVAAVALLLILIISYSVRVISQNRYRNIRAQLENQLFLSQLQQQRDAIQRVNEYKSSFLAATSHDMAQPLEAQGNFIVSLRRLLKNREERELLSKIEDSWKSMKNLLEGLTDISSIDAATMMPRPTEIDLSDLIERLIDEISIKARRKSLQLNTNLEPCTVRTDATLLARILRNVLSNAVKFTPSRGRIDIGAECFGNQAVISIADTGPGVPSDKHVAIFKDYVQLGAPGRGSDMGLGLGLSIVKRLCELLDIEMDFRSAPGAGTRFSFRLPPVDAESASLPAPYPRLKPLRKRLLVITPDKMLREDISRTLSDWQCEVYCSGDAEEAFRIIKTTGSTPDVAIVSLDDSEKTGETVVSLRSRMSSTIPAIVLRHEGDGPRPELDHTTVLDAPHSNRKLHEAVLAASASSLAAE
ncbi:hybrid sensor histidine kinase/response regulator [Hoeflea sp. CAU 1731]